MIHSVAPASGDRLTPRENGKTTPDLSEASGPNDMKVRNREIYTTRYYRHGNSYSVVIPPDIRQTMGLIPGDLLACNFQFGVFWAVKMEPGMIINREKVAKIFDKLFENKDTANAAE